MSLQKESEWEKEFEDRFCTNGYINHELKPEVMKFIQSLLSNREHEIAEEVKKIILEEMKYSVSTYGLTKVLSILKHNQ